jgi:hypothetical protein
VSPGHLPLPTVVTACGRAHLLVLPACQMLGVRGRDPPGLRSATTRLHGRSCGLRRGPLPHEAKGQSLVPRAVPRHPRDWSLLVLCDR